MEVAPGIRGRILVEFKTLLLTKAHHRLCAEISGPSILCRCRIRRPRNQFHLRMKWRRGNINLRGILVVEEPVKATINLMPRSKTKRGYLMRKQMRSCQV